MDRGAERQLLVSSLAGLGDVGEESRGALTWKTQWQISLCTRKILSRRRCEYRHQKESRRNVRLFFRAFAASDHNLAALAYSLNPQDPSFTLSMIRYPLRRCRYLRSLPSRSTGASSRSTATTRTAAAATELRSRRGGEGGKDGRGEGGGGESERVRANPGEEGGDDEEREDRDLRR
jgi:hypothetical protein